MHGLRSAVPAAEVQQHLLRFCPVAAVVMFRSLLPKYPSLMLRL